MDVFGDKIMDHENINTNEPDKTNGQTWLIEYQSEDHGHDHHHWDKMSLYIISYGEKFISHYII